VLTEDHPLAGRGDAYAVSKAEGEREALAVGTAHGLEVVVLRPTLVYGPGSPIWLVGYFERVKSERLALVDGGRGLANLLHVDDLIDAMLLAAERPGIAGEAFLVSGEQPVTWRQYLGYFARMCGKPPPASISRHRAYLEVQWGRLYGTLTGRPRRIAGMDLVEMTQRTRVSIDKARRLLRWEPRVALDAGMNAAEAWLRQQGHLPPAAPSAEEPMRARGAVRVALS
jgi:nucleoside-diphosphate-sugar epimerase